MRCEWSKVDKKALKQKQMGQIPKSHPIKSRKVSKCSQKYNECKNVKIKSTNVRAEKSTQINPHKSTHKLTHKNTHKNCT